MSSMKENKKIILLLLLFFLLIRVGVAILMSQKDFEGDS
ncbi:unnamed protein product, partial [marine sediment metagenome]